MRTDARQRRLHDVNARLHWNPLLNRTFADGAFKPPNAPSVKITTFAAHAFLIFAKWRLAVQSPFCKTSGFN
jgi:hypothetical protein